VRVLVVGYGSMGRRHTASLLALGGCEVAVCDPAAVQTDVPPGVALLDGLPLPEALEFWQPDATVVATPVALHAEHLAALLWRGRPVFVEKPVALDSQLGALATDRPAVVAVGYQLRCHEAARTMRMVVEHGMVGRLLSARFYVGSDVRDWPGASYGDALLECSHELDAARWVLGDPEVEVVGAAHTRDTWAVLLAHRTLGVASTVHLSTEEAIPRRLWSVVGTEGLAAWSWGSPVGGTDDGIVVMARRGEPELTLWRGNSAVFNERAYREELTAFVEAARRGDPAGLPCGLESGLAALRLCAQARQKAQ
jgi:predicted dehydrogenase